MDPTIRPVPVVSGSVIKTVGGGGSSSGPPQPAQSIFDVLLQQSASAQAMVFAHVAQMVKEAGTNPQKLGAVVLALNGAATNIKALGRNVAV